MATYWALAGVFLSLIPSSAAISCLVIRPGYGLVSEQCPASAIGCRIRVMKDRIDWYEWAKLYDRNQLVCVYPEEYKTESGCQRKTSGSIRCWCGGSDDCNDAENSKTLYEAFVGPSGLKQEIKHNRVKTVTTTVATTTTTRSHRKVTPKRITVKSTLKTTTPVPTTTERRTRPTTTSSTSTTTTNTPEAPKNFADVPAHPLPTDERDRYDEIFAETRRTLEEQMREEDEKLKNMLADEEEEMRHDEEEEEEPVETRTAEEENKLERRERARQEERRRQEEEERLARIEREEAEESARRIQREDELEQEEEEYESFGFTSSAASSIPLFTVALLIR